MFYILKIKEFMKDQKGVSPIVASVLIILIAVMLAVLVSDGLKAWIEDLFIQFRNSTNHIQ
ncbi:MAG: archaellin/type IV pilin N-terminal domain-containing protein [Clostridia bacterium]